MGMFKDLKKGVKDLKTTVAAAPAMLDQAQMMQANAKAMQATMEQQMFTATAVQQQMAASAPVVAGADGSGDLEPIAGVSLETYAEVSRGLAAFDYDQSKAVEIAAQRGIDAAAWQQALEGWNLRITANRAVAQRFNRLYMGR